MPLALNFVGRSPSLSEEPQELAEDQLIARCREGDKKALARLVERYQRRAFAIAFGMLRDRESALDAAQEAFVKVFRNIKGFKGDSSFYTWFYRIVTNVCIDHCRRQARAKTVDYDDSYRRRDQSEFYSLSGSTRSMQPQAVYEQSELKEALNEAISKLTENHRTVILLREVEGMSYEDIAETMNCQVGTVMSRLHHARKNLQTALKPYLKASGDLLHQQAGRGVRKQR